MFLKEDLDEILHYLACPEEVLEATFQGGLNSIKQDYDPELLKIRILVSTATRTEDEKAVANLKKKIFNFDLSDMEKLSTGFTLLAQKFKINIAYTSIYQGKKFSDTRVAPPKCDLFLRSSSSIREFTHTRPAYIFTSDTKAKTLAMYYFNGNSVTKVETNSKKVRKLKQTLTMPGRDIEYLGPQELSDKQSRKIISIIGHTHLPNPIEKISRENLLFLIKELKSRKNSLGYDLCLMSKGFVPKLNQIGVCIEDGKLKYKVISPKDKSVESAIEISEVSDELKEIFAKSDKINLKKDLMHHIREILKITSEKGHTHNLPAFGLLKEEVELFSVLLNLPFKLQHATDSYYPVVNAGRLSSYSELNRYNPNYKSYFSTGGNTQNLGNKGFVFFRVYVPGTNKKATRYGKTRLPFDITLLNHMGWISLHDQLIPFSKKTRRFYHGKRLLRIGKVISKKGTKQILQPNITYQYRTGEVRAYGSGKKDVPPFNLKDSKQRIPEFTNEIFYGKDILLGIALSAIYELWQFKECGFYHFFLEKLRKMKDEAERVLLVARLVKKLFRTEGKYPVALNVTANLKTVDEIEAQPLLETSEYLCKAKDPQGKEDRNMDMSVNSSCDPIAKLEKQEISISDRLRKAKMQKGRLEKKHAKESIKSTKDSVEKMQVEISKTQQELRETKLKLGRYREKKEWFIKFFAETFQIPSKKLQEVSVSKLSIVASQYQHLLQNKKMIYNLLNLRNRSRT